MAKKLSQQEVPNYSLEQALRIPKAIAENFAYAPTKPLQVAKALEMQPNSGPFRGICGAAIGYGLTSGGPNAEEISIEPLGLRIVRPTEEGDELAAKREALLQPRIVGEFLNKYNNAPLPPDNIAQNVLEEMGVPQNKVKRVHELILEGAENLHLIQEIKDKKYIDLDNVDTSSISKDSRNDENIVDDKEPDSEQSDTAQDKQEKDSTDQDSKSDHTDNERRVFIAHGKNKQFIEPIKKLLSFGELEAIVAVERTSVSQPMPDKIMKDMRRCGAAIIHVDSELKLIDQQTNEHIVLNPNVLIEIGAAMALYGRRFILLVKEGVQLPSDLQGLYEVRYSGEQLDGNVTIKLLESINDIKNHSIPDRYSE